MIFISIYIHRYSIMNIGELLLQFLVFLGGLFAGALHRLRPKGRIKESGGILITGGQLFSSRVRAESLKEILYYQGVGVGQADLRAGLHTSCKRKRQ